MGVIFKNNVMYGAGDIEISPVCYSEEEREVGCWVDGKPLYQKTVFPSISEINANSFSDSDFADAEMIMIIDGYYTLTNNYLKVALNQYETPQYWCRAGVRNDNSIYMYVNGYTVTGSASITVQYTKTTDTPGSGIWTPSGVPAVHYSENEQVVGTWVDGSTIYEKTVYISALPVSNNPASATQYAHNISNINEIVDFEAIATWPSGLTAKMPYAQISNGGLGTSGSLDITVDTTNIIIRVGTDRRSLHAYVTIRYTKSTSSS